MSGIVRALVGSLVTVVAVTGMLGTASASEIVTRNAAKPTLKVDGRGRAVVSFTSAGRRKNVLYWGAINARPPSTSRRQIAFKRDYSGGWGTFRSHVWKTVRACGRYDGPRLPFLVKACKAPDGTYWALQSWKRMLPNYGFRPWMRSQSVRELHLSHWKGPLPKLEVWLDWSWSGRFHHLFGRYSYRNRAIHGFSSTSLGAPTDTFGRNVYLDTYNSAHGRGWKRENSFLAQRSRGNFCYSFVNQRPPSHYPSSAPRPRGNGAKYRMSAMGPGVTPIVQWTGAGLSDFDRANPAHVEHERAMNVLGDAIAGSGRLCRKH